MSRGRAGSAVALTLTLATVGCASDLFHSTDWQTRCDVDHAACAQGSGGLGAGGAAAGGSGAGGGSGGGPCTPGAKESCYGGPPTTLGVGACKAGTRTCSSDGSGFGPCVGEVTPTAEKCTNDVDDDCDGMVNEECVYASCGDVPKALGSGVYPLDVLGQGTLSIYCDLSAQDGAWALVYASVGSQAGDTLGFWQIAYADRLIVKGTPSPTQNYYAGALYLVGTEYKDELEDTSGKRVEAFRAKAAGFDSASMTFTMPSFESGDMDVYTCHFASGWSSADHDGDTDATDNCAALFANVTQHYCSCWHYNLGADADTPHEDSGWGPHANSMTAATLALSTDGSPYTRLNRALRWTRW